MVCCHELEEVELSAKLRCKLFVIGSIDELLLIYSNYFEDICFFLTIFHKLFYKRQK